MISSLFNSDIIAHGHPPEDAEEVEEKESDGTLNTTDFFSFSDLDPGFTAAAYLREIEDTVTFLAIMKRYPEALQLGHMELGRCDFASDDVVSSLRSTLHMTETLFEAERAGPDAEQEQSPEQALHNAPETQISSPAASPGEQFTFDGGLMTNRFCVNADGIPAPLAGPALKPEQDGPAAAIYAPGSVNPASAPVPRMAAPGMSGF